MSNLVAVSVGAGTSLGSKSLRGTRLGIDRKLLERDSDDVNDFLGATLSIERVRERLTGS